MTFINFAVLSCFSCILLGAFGAHALANILSQELLDTWGTAAQYQMFQSLALLGISIAGPEKIKRLRRSQWGFSLGLILFCGSLYALCLGAPAEVGIITPIGATLWLLSWLNLVQKY